MQPRTKIRVHFLGRRNFLNGTFGPTCCGHPFVEVHVALAAAGAKFIGDTLGSNREVSIVVCGLATGVYQSVERSMLDEQKSACQNAHHRTPSRVTMTVTVAEDVPMALTVTGRGRRL